MFAENNQDLAINVNRENRIQEAAHPQNQERVWNGHRITLVLGSLIAVAGVVTAIVGGVILFGGFTVVSSLTAKIIILAGLSATIAGVIALGINALRQRNQNNPVLPHEPVFESPKGIIPSLKPMPPKPMPPTTSPRSSLEESIPLDLDKAILVKDKSKIVELLNSGKLDVDKNGKDGIPYILRVILEHPRDIVILFAAKSKTPEKYEDLQQDFENKCKEMLITQNKLKENITIQFNNIKKKGDIAQTSERLHQLILEFCPPTYRNELYRDPELNLNEKLNAKSDGKGNNFWHLLADMAQTPKKQAFLHNWLVKQAKDKLKEKNANGLTPVDVALEKKNLQFILTITDPSNSELIDWKDPHFKKLIQEFLKKGITKLDSTAFKEGEKESFLQMVYALAKCNPSAINIEEIDSLKKSKPRTSGFWNLEKVKLQDKEALAWSRQVDEKLSALQLKFYKENGQALLDHIKQKEIETRKRF